MFTNFSEVSKAKEAYYDRYFKKSLETQSKFYAANRLSSYFPLSSPMNFAGVAIGQKQTEGRDTLTCCIKVYVFKKTAKSKLSKKHRIPKTCGGVPTDVIEIGRPKLNVANCLRPKARQRRPVNAGVSISGHRKSSGSLGILVRKKHSSNIYILSNYHVMRHLRKNMSNDFIYQPGNTDTPTIPQNVIGTYFDGMPIKISQPGAIHVNTMDVGLAKTGPEAVRDYLCRVGKIKKTTGALAARDPVWMFGRTSQGVFGEVQDVDADLRIPVSDGLILFRHQLRISPTNRCVFGKSGDSGSVILNRKNEVSALHFASDGKSSGFATPIKRIFDQFGLVIA